MERSQEYSFLLCWAKEKLSSVCVDLPWSTPVLTDFTRSQLVLNTLRSCEDGSFFIQLLNAM